MNRRRVLWRGGPGLAVAGADVGMGAIRLSLGRETTERDKGTVMSWLEETLRSTHPASVS